MNSTLLVFLSLVAGAAAGAGFAVLALPERPAPEPAAHVVAAMPPPAHDEAVSSKPEDKPSDEYMRLAQALIALDERMSEMNSRDQSAQTKVESLLDDVRELALQLEIRSGKLRPLQPGRGEPPVPVRSRDSQAAAGQAPRRDRGRHARLVSALLLQSLASEASSASINSAMVASVSSPMLEMRKVVPLIFP